MSAKVKEWSRDGYSDERSGDFYNDHDEWHVLVACLDGVATLYDIPDKCNAIRVCLRQCAKQPSGSYEVFCGGFFGAYIVGPNGRGIGCPYWLSMVREEATGRLWVWVEIDA